MIGSDRSALIDGYYAFELPEHAGVPRALARWPHALAAPLNRIGALRGLALTFASIRYEAIVCVRADPGWRSLLLGRAVLGRRRKLVVLQFIVHPHRAGGRGRLADVIWDPIDRWAVRRAMRRGQVLSAWERDEYAVRYRLRPERFVYVPWAWRRTPAGGPPPPRGAGVLAAGRAFCDWPTLFAAEEAEAAEGRPWKLTVVCGGHDLGRVRNLNRAGRAMVHCDIPERDYARLLAQTGVLVIPMRDAGISQGHARLTDANQAGVPVVASATRSLQRYTTDGVNALLVPSGDPQALARAVRRLLEDAALAERLRTAAWERSAAWTWSDYIGAIRAVIADRPPDLPPDGQETATGR